MNTINDAQSKGFSEVLASVPTMALAQKNKQAINLVRQSDGTDGGKPELLKQQFAINERFWNMVVAASISSDRQGSFRDVDTESAKTTTAEAAMALRLVSAYGTKATEAITGRLDTDGTTLANRAMARRTEFPGTESLKKMNLSVISFSLAA